MLEQATKALGVAAKDLQEFEMEDTFNGHHFAIGAGLSKAIVRATAYNVLETDTGNRACSAAWGTSTCPS